MKIKQMKKINQVKKINRLYKDIDYRTFVHLCKKKYSMKRLIFTCQWLYKCYWKVIIRFYWWPNSFGWNWLMYNQSWENQNKHVQNLDVFTGLFPPKLTAKVLATLLGVKLKSKFWKETFKMLWKSHIIASTNTTQMLQFIFILLFYFNWKVKKCTASLL